MTSRILLLALLAAAPVPADAETLTFRGGGAPEAPQNFQSYLVHVYCERLPPGAAMRDRNCQAVRRWVLGNLVRPAYARQPVPDLD